MAREASSEFTVEGALDEGGAVAIDPGRVAFLDYTLVRIVVLDTTGQVTASFGRHGGGPGELLNPRFLVRTRRGIGVVDDQKYALVTFDAEGHPRGDLPLESLIGVPTGIVTGMAQLDDATWVFAANEKTPTTYRQALYVRSGGITRELAATPAAPTRPVRLPCGIILSSEPPVFWPTLRWSAAGGRVAYATSVEDRIVVRDPATTDSQVFSGGAEPRPATEEEALALAIGARVQLGARGCELTRAEALRQRGMSDLVPAIERITLSPGGAVWARLRTNDPGGPVRLQIADRAARAGAAPFPMLFTSTDRFLSEASDSAGNTEVTYWRVPSP